jgi:hypothetical protein
LLFSSGNSSINVLGKGVVLPLGKRQRGIRGSELPFKKLLSVVLRCGSRAFVDSTPGTCYYQAFVLIMSICVSPD